MDTEPVSGQAEEQPEEDAEALPEPGQPAYTDSDDIDPEGDSPVDPPAAG